MIKIVWILIVMVLLQHMVHESAHIVVARLMNIKIIKVHWLTYSKCLGTRIYYENEPDLKDNQIDKKWGGVSLAGGGVTTLIGYVAIVLYCFNLESLVLFMMAVIFVLMDSFYFMMGSFFSFGDVLGIGRAFKIPRWLLISGSMCLFLFNIYLVNQYVWN